MMPGQNEAAQQIIAQAISRAKTREAAEALKLLAVEARLRHAWQEEAIAFKQAIVSALDASDGDIRRAVVQAIRDSDRRAHEHDEANGLECDKCGPPCEVVPLFG